MLAWLMYPESWILLGLPFKISRVNTFNLSSTLGEAGKERPEDPEPDVFRVVAWDGRGGKP